MNEKEIESLIKLLDDPDQEIASHVEEKLLSYGNDVINHLENAWGQSLDSILQERIENLVHKIQFQNIKKELELWYIGGAFDLLQGILIINKYQYPDLDEQKVINQLEDIKRDIWMQMIYDMSPVEKVKLINHVIYGTNGHVLLKVQMELIYWEYISLCSFLKIFDFKIKKEYLIIKQIYN